MHTRYLLPARALFVAFLLARLITATGCAEGPSRRPELTMLGSFADLKYRSGRLENVELIALQDDTLYLQGDGFIAIPADSVNVISLRKRESRNWTFYVVLGQLLPAAFVSLAPSVDDDLQTVGVVMGGLGIITWATWEFSTPESVFQLPLGESAMREFALHLRFPYGIERGRLAEIAALARRSNP